MLQLVDKKLVYVVDFDTMPELPIESLSKAERMYMNLVQFASGTLGSLVVRDTKVLYARALTNAIETGVITEPGKYGIYLGPSGSYEIFKVVE